MMKTSKILTLALCLALLGHGGMAKTLCSPKAKDRGIVLRQESGCNIGAKDPAATAAPVTPSGSLAEQVVAQVNAERAKAGLNSLRVDSELTRAACVRVGEIAVKFSHTRPDGSAWSTVSKSAYGENIAMGQRTADKVMAAWMSSEGHRQNILRASFGSIGVCAATVNGVTYWVQLFGK